VGELNETSAKAGAVLAALGQAMKDR
jgi:hypothetical protein